MLNNPGFDPPPFQQDDADALREAYQSALTGLRRYREQLLDQVAEEASQIDVSFDNPYVGSAENVVEKYWQLILGTCTICGSLQERFEEIAPPPPPPPAKPRVVTRVKVLEVEAGESSEAALNEWLEENPGVEVSSIDMAPRGEGMICTLVYLTEEDVEPTQEFDDPLDADWDLFKA